MELAKLFADIAIEILTKILMELTGETKLTQTELMQTELAQTKLMQTELM